MTRSSISRSEGVRAVGCISALCCCVIAIGPPLVGASNTQSQDGPRRFMSTGRPIVEQLQSDDRHVVMELNASIDASSSRSESRVRFLDAESDTVLVILLEERAPEFVWRQFFENTPAPVEDANWIRSRASGRIERIVKSETDMLLAIGDRVSFEEDGGTATVRGIQVDAVLPWARPLVVGRRYLVFGRYADGEFERIAIYEEGRSGLMQTLVRPLPVRPETAHRAAAMEDEFEQWGLEEAIQRIQAAVAARTQRLRPR